MGVEAPAHLMSGKKTPKLGLLHDKSQKSLNRQRDQHFVQGTFKLAYEDNEMDRNVQIASKKSDCLDFQKRGLKQVKTVESLRAFQINSQEKEHFSDINQRQLFQQKIRPSGLEYKLDSISHLIP
uniref:Uncharacterized protein n=1 Tax=Strombidium rassoulzadegani TaxID=1082188 RepID=A0A7S3CMF5_9SPIT|mmetsp:Transcript_17438/g.29341  ORF Transcript_17438/g.29341 Transcript_17438/m.29341 type:complete len:125 (+) Transcript_17438:394-768(+)